MANSNSSKQTDLLGQAETPNSSELAKDIKSNGSIISTTESSASSSSTESTKSSESAGKKLISKKFHQEEFTAPSGNKYLVTFPGTARASRLQSENNANLVSLHQMFMRNILEGKYDYKYFDDLNDDVSRSTDVTVSDENGEDEEFHIRFKSYRQLDDVIDQAFNANGTPDIYQFAQYIFDNLIEENVNFAYFDEHAGFNEIQSETLKLITDLQQNSEYGFVINKVQDFMNRMFR